MSKQTKKWLMIAAGLVVLGLILSASVMTAYRWDFTRLSTVKYETNTYEVDEAFSDLSVNTETADLLFAPSQDGTCKVVCYEPQDEKHSVAVQDGTLTINQVNGRNWREYIGFRVGPPKITVYLPESEYASLFIEENTGDIEITKDFTFADMDISVSTGDVTSFASASERVQIKTSTGDIHVENLSAGAMDLSASTGKVTVSDITCEGDLTVNVSTSRTNMTNVRCKNLLTDGSTGALSLKNVIAEETFSIERSTGDVNLDGCDAAEIFIKTGTGDVRGSLLSDKIFMAQANIGSVDVPNTATGGKCEINTNMGDIKLEIQ